jgi:hypothetical protein
LALLTQPGIGGRSGTPTWTPFATALYVTTDHFLIDNPQHRPWLRGSGSPRASKTPNWSPWPCCSAARIHLRGAMVALREQPTARAVPCLPTQSGYNKRLRAATGMLRAVIAHLVACTSQCTDDVWAVDSTPVAGDRGRPPNAPTWPDGPSTVSASHSRFFWGLRLHLVCALSGLPVAFALTGAKADEPTLCSGCSTPIPTCSRRIPVRR